MISTVNKLHMSQLKMKQVYIYKQWDNISAHFEFEDLMQEELRYCDTIQQTSGLSDRS